MCFYFYTKIILGPKLKNARPTITTLKIGEILGKTHKTKYGCRIVPMLTRALYIFV